MKPTLAFVLAALSSPIPITAQNAWVERYTECTPPPPIYDPWGMPIGKQQICGYPEIALFTNWPYSGTVWMPDLYYWTAASSPNLDVPAGDRCVTRDIIAAPDQTIWATSPTQAALCHVQLGEGGVTVTAYTLPLGSTPDSLVVGQDGLLWVTDTGRDLLLHLDLSGAILDEFALEPGCGPEGLSVAPDGTFWIALYESSSIAHVNGPDKAVLSTTALASGTHPYKLVVSPKGQVCYIGSNPDYVGCLNASGTLLQETALPPTTVEYNPRRVDERSQMIVGPDGFIWLSDPELDMVRFDEEGNVIPYSVGIKGNGIAAQSDGIWFVFNNPPGDGFPSDGAAGFSKFVAAFTQLSASPSPVAEGAVFTLTGTLTRFNMDPNLTITLPAADPVSPFDLSPEKRDIDLSQDFVLEAASGTNEIDVIYKDKTTPVPGNGTNSASAKVSLTQINSPPNVSDLTIASRALVGAETTLITGTVSDIGTEDRFLVYVNFGDDWPPATFDWMKAGTFTASHTYFNPGTYTLRYSIYDLGGDLITGAANVTVTAPKSVPKVSITVSNSFVPPGAATTFTASVSGGGSLPTGVVAFQDGAMTIGQANLDSKGMVSYTTTSLANGRHEVIGAYAGDANYSAADSSPVQVIASSDPFFNVSGTAISIISGATFGNTSTISITPAQGFVGSVSLAAAITSGPANAQYPPTMSFGATNIVTITGTTPATATLAIFTTAGKRTAYFRPKGGAFLLGETTIGYLACLIVLGPTHRRLKRLLNFLFLALCGIACGAIACGGGSSSGSEVVPVSGTTAGNYTITISATSGPITQLGTVRMVVK